MAKVEFFEHFAEEAQLAGVVGADVENLRGAIAGETYEIKTMYKEFAEAATEAGDASAAVRFDEVKVNEAKHRAAFKAMLANIQQELP